MSQIVCECEEERTGKNGRTYIVCRCPRPADWKPALVYGVKPSEWRRLRKEVIARDGAVCRYCGATEGTMQADHVVPWTRGGATDLSNLAVACADCNRSKRNTLLENWKGRP